MKKYAVFTFDQYYPRGGWDDYLISFDNIFEAFEFVKNPENVRIHYQIVNIEESQIVAEK